jgi:uncharacterized protein with ParB-like and HNH nuclease domain
MKANEIKFDRFLAQPDTQFIIPVYQRNYDWTQLQCMQLLDDIFAAGEDESLSSHFIGSIVYIHDDVYHVSGIRELSIIDGQQRLTTITLLYIAIYATAKEINNIQLVNRVQETYLINKFAKEEEKLKLRPTENNDEALKFLLRNNPDDEFREYSRLIENYNYLKNRIDPKNLDTVLKGLGKLVFVEISLERDKDDPQKIFESLNSTGLDLSQSDLIRNYILMGLKHKDQIEIYDNFWKLIELNATHEETNTNKVSDFIRDFLTFENREIPNKGKVYQEFKKKYPVTNNKNLEKVLGKIKKYSYYYNKFINPQNERDIEIRNQLIQINKLEINVAYPFMLEVYNDYSTNVIDKSTLIEVFELVQSFTWRRFIIGLPTNALNKIFMRLYEDIDSSDYIRSLQQSLIKKKSGQRFPGNKEVIATLKERDMYAIHTKNRNYFLERLENYENREYVKIDGNPNITIEHIFPQNPDEKWKQALGEQEFNLIQEKYLNTIANLTLSGNNGKLSNKYFTDKRDMNEENKEQGYKYSRLWLNRHLSNLNKWDVEEIEKRFELIADRFLKIWTYPPLNINLDADNQEVNIFEAEDPKNKKLEYAIFFDQKIEVREVAKLYTQIIKQLFEMQPETFFSTDLGKRIGLTKTPTDGNPRQPVAINDTYYIEGNIDNVGKFDRIKQALTLFDFEDELTIKYAADGISHGADDLVDKSAGRSGRLSLF